MTISIKIKGFNTARRRAKWYADNAHEAAARAIYPVLKDIFEESQRITPIGPDADHGPGGRYAGWPHLIEMTRLFAENSEKTVWILDNIHPNALLVHEVPNNYTTNNPNGQFEYLQQAAERFEGELQARAASNLNRMVRSRRLIGAEPVDLKGSL